VPLVICYLDELGRAEHVRTPQLFSRSRAPRRSVRRQLRQSA
jgi:hypothetical protein